MSYSPKDRFQFGDVPRYGHRRPPKRWFTWTVAGMFGVALLAMVWRATSDAGSVSAAPPSPVAASPDDAPSPTSDGSPKPPPAVPLPIQKIIDYGKPIYCGGGNQPMVALTFDDGPGPYTEYTMDTLRASGAGATFFLVSKLFYSTTNQRIAKQEARMFEVGNHARSHFGLAGEPSSVLEAEVAKPKKQIEKYADTQVIYFRPPWGSRDAALDDFVRSLGMATVMWTFDTYDSSGAKAEEIAAAVGKHAKPGSIILLHENRGTTRTALPMILQALSDKGLRSVTLSTLLSQDPPTKQQLRQGIAGC